MALMRGVDFSWGALPLQRRVRDHATARSCWSARSRTIRCGRSRSRSACDDLSRRSTLQHVRAQHGEPHRAARRAARAFRHRTRTAHWIAALEARTCCARRCATCRGAARPADRDQRDAAARAAGQRRRASAWSARRCICPMTGSRCACRRRESARMAQTCSRSTATTPMRSPGCARTACSRDDPTDDRRARRARHHRPAGGAQRARSGATDADWRTSGRGSKPIATCARWC